MLDYSFTGFHILLGVFFLVFFFIFYALIKLLSLCFLLQVDQRPKSAAGAVLREKQMGSGPTSATHQELPVLLRCRFGSWNFRKSSWSTLMILPLSESYSYYSVYAFKWDSKLLSYGILKLLTAYSNKDEFICRFKLHIVSYCHLQMCYKCRFLWILSQLRINYLSVCTLYWVNILSGQSFSYCQTLESFPVQYVDGSVVYSETAKWTKRNIYYKLHCIFPYFWAQIYHI